MRAPGCAPVIPEGGSLHPWLLGIALRRGERDVIALCVIGDLMHGQVVPPPVSAAPSAPPLPRRRADPRVTVVLDATDATGRDGIAVVFDTQSVLVNGRTEEFKRTRRADGANGPSRPLLDGAIGTLDGPPMAPSAC